MTAREEVLGRIRTALGGAGAGNGAGAGSGGYEDAVPRGYRLRGDLEPEAMLERLTERLRDYGCSVRHCGPATLAETVAAALSERGVERVVVPAGLEVPVPGVALEVDAGFSAQELDAFDGVITTATLAIAETGTIVLDGSAGQGRRALTLVPDYHLCVVHASQVVGLVPEAVTALSARRPLTWISGPSATSDIELDRVEGVHGPRTLEVIVVRS